MKKQLLFQKISANRRGSLPLISNPENYNNIYEIVLEELRQKKIPFIIKRPLNDSYEFWKLEDLKIL